MSGGRCDSCKKKNASYKLGDKEYCKKCYIVEKDKIKEPKT